MSANQLRTILGNHIAQRKAGKVKDMIEEHGVGIISSGLSKSLKNQLPEIYAEYRHLLDNQDLTDYDIAKCFCNKVKSSQDRGIDFELTLLGFSNLMKAKTCYYTGLPLEATTRSVDRVDDSKGYIKGNVVACHTAINQMKSILEREMKGRSRELLRKALLKWSKSL